MRCCIIMYWLGFHKQDTRVLHTRAHTHTQTHTHTHSHTHNMLKTILLFILILFKAIVKDTQKLKLSLPFSYWLFNTFYMSQYCSVGSIPSSPIQSNSCPCVLWVWRISSQEVAGKDLSLPRGWNPNSEFSNCTTSLAMSVCVWLWEGHPGNSLMEYWPLSINAMGQL